MVAISGNGYLIQFEDWASFVNFKVYKTYKLDFV